LVTEAIWKLSTFAALCALGVGSLSRLSKVPAACANAGRRPSRGATFQPMVHIPKLLKAVEALAWRHGCTRGDEVTHEGRLDGSHVITIVVPQVLVDPDSLPKAPAKPTSWGPTR
jgi:hypothetical protein